MRQLAKVIFAALVLCVVAMPVAAHGVRITYTIDAASGEITVLALYDTGDPLADAAITIFAPNDIINPWMSSTTDETGSYTFLPDYEVAGFWDVQVRLAGHGGLVNIEITPDMAPAAPAEDSADTNVTSVEIQDGTRIVITGDARFEVSGNIIINAADGTAAQVAAPATAASPLTGGDSGFTTAQILIMSVSVIWGFIGTALYFAQRRKQ